MALLVAFTRVEFSLSLLTVTIAHLVYVFPFFFLIARAALERLDPALEETASDLGANRWTVFRRVTLPQVWPVLVGAACLAFALSFDEFVITFFVIGPDSTLPMYIWSSLRRTIDPSINAISSLLLAFTMLLFVVTFALTTWSERRRRGRGLAEDPLVLTGPAEGARERRRVARAPRGHHPPLRLRDGARATSRSTSRPASCSRCSARRAAARRRCCASSPASSARREGRVLIDGEDVTSLPANRRPTNLVFQRPTLFPHLDVFANVAFGLQVARVGRAEQRERVAEALALVRLEGYEKRRSHELSGGQMQRIALARALVNRPAVLLLDEPLSALDLKIRLEMEVELRRVHRETGATFVYVTHDQREAMALSDRLVVMNQGRVEQVGTPTEVYSCPASVFAAQFVGNANVLPVEVLESGDGRRAAAAREPTPGGSRRPASSPGRPGSCCARRRSA